jgi:membrane-bound serine protease (ClpP class)
MDFSRISLRVLTVVLIALIFSGALAGSYKAQSDNLVMTINIEGTITAGTANQVRRGIETAQNRNAEALLILMDTPGGLVDATLNIVQSILNSPVPVVVYVYPQGAIAASAGTFILVSSNVAVMSPGTTIGAAMPVTISPGEGGSTAADDKTINFLAGHIKSIARDRERPADIAEKFVTENLTLDSTEALDVGIVDFISGTLPGLLEDIDGFETVAGGENIILQTAGAEIENIEMSLIDKITSLISDPQVAFLLILLGIYGLIIGFGAPETFFPEVLGAISLVLGLYGLGTFEVNVFAALLIILGIVLFVAEAFTPTFGVLAIGGIISMVLGIMFLPVEPLMPVEWISRFRFFGIGIGIASAGVMVVILRGIIKLKRSKVVMGNEEFNTQAALVVKELNPVGMIKVKGEIWQAVSKSGENIPEGSEVVISGRDGMKILVERIDDKTKIKEGD